MKLLGKGLEYVKKGFEKFTHLRKEIRLKNLNKPFWNLKYEKSIQIIHKGGWHFNNLYNIKTISKKLRTFQHIEFSDEKYSSEENIRKKIFNLEDLFGRKQKYEIVDIGDDFPEYIRCNLKVLKIIYKKK